MAQRPIDIARSILDTPEQDPRIREYLRNGGVNMDPATQAWCAQFVNATLAQAGLKGTGSGAARSFLNYGDPVLSPRQGDIAVFARQEDTPENRALGHAGFYESTDPYGRFNILGGNQGDAANIMPIEPDRLLGFRRPPGTPEEKLPDVLATAVSPGVAKGISAVDYSKGINRTDQTRPEMNLIGGTETPTLATAFDVNRNYEKRIQRQRQIREALAALATRPRQLPAPTRIPGGVPRIMPGRF
jgi:uncharacterized protein (TIGR02594 family)